MKRAIQKIIKSRKAITQGTKVALVGTVVMGTLLVAIVIGFLVLAPQGETIVINGAGATFPFPIIQTWIDEYTDLNSNVRINYASIGSGGGVRQIQSKTVDFGASDAPLTAEEYENMPGILHVPEVIGADVVAYHLKDASGNIIEGLKLNGTVIANIFLGKITRWNDPAIQDHNPDLSLPDEPIVVVHRSDGSGTTFIFTEYLAKVSDEWNQTVGVGKSVQWPIGIGAKGNEGVTASIIQTEGAIGYIELSYYLANSDKLGVVHVQNQAGNYIEPTETSIAAAAAAFAQAGALPSGNASWEGVSITDPPATRTDAYPISSLTYILIYQDLNNVKDLKTAQALLDFLWWIIHEGQALVGSQNNGVPGYVPLPNEIVTINENTLKMVTYKGTPLDIPDVS